MGKGRKKPADNRNGRLGDNLRLNGSTGEIYLEDGGDVAAYLRETDLAEKGDGTRLVMMSREDFDRLRNLAMVGPHLIRAA